MATTTETRVDVVVVGAGPCGLATAISLQRAGFSTLIFDAACVCSSITQYPTYATFFSTAPKLSLGGLPFIIPDAKPTRRDALAYYRAVVAHFDLRVRQYEAVERIAGVVGDFTVHSKTRSGRHGVTYAQAVVVATGYWGSPNLLNVPGENLPHVSHVFREGHGAFQQRVVVVGGGNSAAEAALELWRTGAHVTLVHFGPTFDKKIKPWVRPDLENRIAEGSIAAQWNSRVTAIEPEAVVLAEETPDGGHPQAERRGLEILHRGSEPHARVVRLPADQVFLLTGFAPNVDLLWAAGVTIDPATGIPAHDPGTLETDVAGIFIAGVVVAGYDANKVFIENGRFHGERIVAKLRGEAPPDTPGISRDLDGG